ncbi:von Willebrand factor type A domain-containing protein [Nocardioides albertanoniae]|uniref:von Willebrand factor type A domain-containing protein n=1 Tax=Nocardioides albertanoniae TaxID=1175486 RepID=A0A543ACK6_9ACTN|nr:substrate-binding domain-containing protein [Nocardioides albertanoniae]TQL70321.1 von Willebrand factor type A domain-containing protein [Nocardioides albertanoniae]
MSGKAGSSTSKALAIIEPEAPAEPEAEVEPRFTKQTIGVVAGAVGVLALCLLTTAMVTSGKATQTVTRSCTGPQMNVAAAPQAAKVLRKILDDAGCKQIEVKATEADQVLSPMALGDDLPDVWIPDSSRWLDRISPAEEPVTLRSSMASSPVVLVSGDGLIRRSYAEAFADDDLLVGDPQRMMSALGTVIAGEANPANAAKLKSYADRIASDEDGSAPTDSGRLAELRTVASGVTATSEQQWSSYAPMLKASAPKEGTVVLDYPVILTANSSRRNTLASSITNFARVLDSDAADETLTKAGFRTSGAGKPSPNVGAFTEVDPATVKKTAAEWSQRLRPTRGIAAIDVSGSMAFPSGDGVTTRLQLTQAAAAEAIKDLPATAAIGLWAFSEETEGKLGGDHAALVPTRSLGTKGQRDLLSKEIAGLTARTGGGTALHDTTLAAYEAAVASYDPLASNTVLLFTDGTNEDADSMDLAELVRRLKAASDPHRPVRVIGVGITADADMGALRTIAEATGGAAYVAERPEDVGSVLHEAIGRR